MCGERRQTLNNKARSTSKWFIPFPSVIAVSIFPLTFLSERVRNFEAIFPTTHEEAFTLSLTFSKWIVDVDMKLSAEGEITSLSNSGGECFRYFKKYFCLISLAKLGIRLTEISMRLLVISNKVLMISFGRQANNSPWNSLSSEGRRKEWQAENVLALRWS